MARARRALNAGTSLQYIQMYYGPIAADADTLRLSNSKRAGAEERGSRGGGGSSSRRREAYEYMY